MLQCGMMFIPDSDSGLNGFRVLSQFDFDSRQFSSFFSIRLGHSLNQPKVTSFHIHLVHHWLSSVRIRRYMENANETRIRLRFFYNITCDITSVDSVKMGSTCLLTGSRHSPTVTKLDGSLSCSQKHDTKPETIPSYLYIFEIYLCSGLTFVYEIPA
jgi:hypothetical protein